MAASVLNPPKAIEVSVFVVRAFVQLRQTIAGHKELARKIAQVERKLSDHDDQIQVLVEAIKQLMDPKPPPKKGESVFRNNDPNHGVLEVKRLLIGDINCEWAPPPPFYDKKYIFFKFIFLHSFIKKI